MRVPESERDAPSPEAPRDELKIRADCSLASTLAQLGGRERLLELASRSGGVIGGVWAMALERKDVSAKADKMPRGSCLLYRSKKTERDDPWSYWGVLKQDDGKTFWVFAWPRLVKGEPVIELKFTPKRS